MSKIIEIKKKPAAPWYIAGAVWVVGALALPIYELWALGLVAAASVAALAAAFKLCPPVIEKKEVPWFTGREDADEMLSHIDADRKRLRMSAFPTTPSAQPSAGWKPPATAF